MKIHFHLIKKKKIAKRRKSNRGRRVERITHRINWNIRSREVRLVGNEEESQNGLFPTQVALRMAEEMGVDLVEINGKQEPPICKLIEYTKFKYDLKKKQKEAKAKQHVTQMKEIRFGPNTDQHDFDFKLRHAQKFLTDGNKIKAYVHFRGRSIIYKDQGKKVLLEFATALEDLAKVELLPKMEGKRMHIILAPKIIPKSKK